MSGHCPECGNTLCICKEIEAEALANEQRSFVSSSCSVLWVTAIVLSRRDAGQVTTSQTISHRFGCSEDEARGAAVKFALDAKPGFSVDIVTTVPIELPSQNAPALGAPATTNSTTETDHEN